jgi:hypothetical protein
MRFEQKQLYNADGPRKNIMNNITLATAGSIHYSAIVRGASTPGSPGTQVTNVEFSNEDVPIVKKKLLFEHSSGRTRFDGDR